MQTKHIIITLIIMTIPTSCRRETTPAYPATATEPVADNYFGTTVQDPYRWLENDTSAATAAWIQEQNKTTNAYLEKIPFRNQLKQRLTELLNYERISIPIKRNGKYYYLKNSGLQDQSILYARNKLHGPEETILDPNTLSTDGTVALTGFTISPDGKYLAATITRKGSDWTEILVTDLQTGQPTGDHIQWTKFSHPAWHGAGFYYSAYPPPSEGHEYTNINQNHTIYYHRIGTPQSHDTIAYHNPQQPKQFYHAETDHNQQLLIIHESGAGAGNNLLIKNLAGPSSRIKTLTTNMEYTYTPIELVDNKLYILTNYNAPRYRIMTADPANPQLENWTELIPETQSVITAAHITGRKLIIIHETDAAHHASVYTLNGQHLHNIPHPTPGTLTFSSAPDDPETFYTFTSYTTPTTIYQYNPDNNKSTPFITPKTNFNPDHYTTLQTFYQSPDGTRIPIYITHKKEIPLDGQNPTLLYGYGGFNISLNPTFSATRIALLERGVIYATANIRGGGEYGRQWHQAGTLQNKQNVFDDFTAAAEYLISNNYTNPSKLAITGGSNGGLLIGAVVNQHPELFRVAVPQVGVMDMLRYHRFTIGWNWASDYGTSDDSPEMFRYLLSYSPLHNIRNNGVPYPAILVTTADHDDRVVPAHSFKYAAALQAADTGPAPKLIRIDANAGHGSGKPLGKQIEETADIYSFILYNLRDRK
jgi:prolyl oligopeptidase